MCDQEHSFEGMSKYGSQDFFGGDPKINTIKSKQLHKKINSNNKPTLLLKNKSTPVLSLVSHL